MSNFPHEKNVNAEVPQGSILAPLLFFIYINYLKEGLSSNTELFADDNPLFSVTHDIQTSANNPRSVKSLQIRSFFWSVFSGIQSEYKKIRTRKNSVLDTFHAVFNKELKRVSKWAGQWKMNFNPDATR